MWTHLVYNPGKQPVHSVQRSAVCAVAGNNNVFIFASPAPAPCVPCQPEPSSHPSVTRRPPELRVWSEWASVRINHTQWGRDVNNMKLLWKLWRRCERPNSRSSLFIDSQITKTKWHTETKYHRDIHNVQKKTQTPLALPYNGAGLNSKTKLLNRFT